MMSYFYKQIKTLGRPFGRERRQQTKVWVPSVFLLFVVFSAYASGQAASPSIMIGTQLLTLGVPESAVLEELGSDSKLVENKLLGYLGSHEVFTASFKGWDGLKNGKLLDVAESDGFDLLLTGDQTLYYEQRLVVRRLAVIAMSSVEWRIVGNHLQQILKAIDSAVPGSFQGVDCGQFSRKRTPEE